MILCRSATVQIGGLVFAGGQERADGRAHLEGEGKQGQVDVLPLERVQQRSRGMHRSTHRVPLLGHH